MNKITYTFIIPHHNCPDLLNRCLDSIPQRKDIQIIVVDDNSDEGKKPKESQRPEIEYIYIDKSDSKGAGRARNKGLAKARGKWLLFADSDDYYNDGFLDILDKYKDSFYDIVYFNFEFRDGKTLDILPKLNFQKYFDEFDNSLYAKDCIRFRHNVPWTKLISRYYVTKYNLYFEEVPNGNDILFSMMAGYFTKNITVEKDCVYVYLRNENSILTTKNQSVDSYLCKITHRIKQNQFYKYIKHPEWRTPLFQYVISCIHQKGFKLGLSFIVNLYNNIKYKDKDEWIEIIKSRKHNQF